MKIYMYVQYANYHINGCQKYFFVKQESCKLSLYYSLVICTYHTIDQEQLREYSAGAKASQQKQGSKG